MNGEPNGVKERNFIFNLKKNKVNIFYFSKNQATLFCPLACKGPLEGGIKRFNMSAMIPCVIFISLVAIISRENLKKTFLQKVPLKFIRSYGLIFGIIRYIYKKHRQFKNASLNIFVFVGNFF